MNSSTAYAVSLLELAEEYHCEDEIYEAVCTLKSVLEKYPQYIQITSSPAVSLYEKNKLFGELLAEAPRLLRNTILTACQKNQPELFYSILEEYIKEYYRVHDIVSTIVISAVPLEKEKLSRLEKVLAEKTKKQILLENQVESTCVGGLKIQMQGMQYDGSIQRKLHDIEQLLAE